MVPELLSGAGFGAEGEALLASNRGSCTVEVAEGGCTCPLENLLMIFPKGNNHKVIGQGPGYGSKRSFLLGPWGKEKGELGHAEGASLWDATGVVVGKAESSSKSVILYKRQLLHY